jgi:hypothetical protein
MKRTGFISMIICCMTGCMTSCVNISVNGVTGKKLIGNGIVKEKERGVMDFDAIDTGGSVDVVISEQSDAPVKVSGDENLIDAIETCVEDGTLKVRFNGKWGYVSRNGLCVTVPNNGRIREIKASGSSDVMIKGCVEADDLFISGKGSSDIKGNIKARNCELQFSGSADYKGNVEAVSCEIHCSGSSDCIISGSAEICDISMSGSSDFKGYDFVAEKLQCSASGSSDIMVTCTGELNVNARGSSDVYYKGDARVVSSHLSGASGLYHK